MGRKGILRIFKRKPKKVVEQREKRRNSHLDKCVKIKNNNKSKYSRAEKSNRKWVKDLYIYIYNTHYIYYI